MAEIFQNPNKNKKMASKAKDGIIEEPFLDEDDGPPEEFLEPIEGEVVEESGEETAVAKTEVNVLAMSREERTTFLEARYEYMTQSRELALKKLDKPSHFSRWAKDSFRLTKSGANVVSDYIGVSYRIVGRKFHPKEDGSTTYETICRAWFSEYPKLTKDRSGFVNSNEKFYRSQIEADAKKVEEWKRKFKPGATVTDSLDHNIMGHSETRSIINAVMAMVLMEDLTEIELRKHGINTKELKQVY